MDMTTCIDRKKRLASHTEGVRRRPSCKTGSSVLPLVRFFHHLCYLTWAWKLPAPQNQLPIFTEPPKSASFLYCSLWLFRLFCLQQRWVRVGKPLVWVKLLGRTCPSCFVWSMCVYTYMYVQILPHIYACIHTHTHNLGGNISKR